MAAKRKVTRVPVPLFILAVIALAIPLTVIFSQQTQNLQQDASTKKRITLPVGSTSHTAPSPTTAACSTAVAAYSVLNKCDNNKFRKITFVCTSDPKVRHVINGANNNGHQDCLSKSEWYQRAKARCAQNTPSCKALTPTPAPTAPIVPPLTLSCVSNGVTIYSPGRKISVRLTDGNKRPVPGAKIMWTSQSFSLTRTASGTDVNGYAGTYVSIPYNLGTSGKSLVTATHPAPLNSKTFTTVTCNTSFTWYSQASNPSLTPHITPR